MTAPRFLPYGRQEISEEDIAAVAAVLRSDFLTTGPAVEAFEAALARQVGAAHAVVCANGTAALHLALAALKLPADAGLCAIVPTITFVATANMAEMVGLEVVFADVDPDTALMTPETLRAALARARASGLTPRVVMPVHFAGQSPDMAALHAIASAEGCVVIDDAAHAIGSRSQGGVWVGGDPCAVMTTFSFHPVKTVAMGEGGAVTTDDPDLAESLRRLRGHGLVRDPAEFTYPERAYSGNRPNPWYHEMPEPGLNYRATDIQCALGLSQMQRLEGFVARRADLVAAYHAMLAPLAPLVRPLPCLAGQRPGWHLFVALIDYQAAGTDRARVMEALKAAGVGSQVHYIPVHSQPHYAHRWPGLSLPGADEYYRRALSLPLFPSLTEEEMARVCAALAAAVGP